MKKTSKRRTAPKESKAEIVTGTLEIAAGGYGFVRVSPIPLSAEAPDADIKAQHKEELNNLSGRVWNVWTEKNARQEKETEIEGKEAPMGEDIFIPQSKLRRALNNDKVKVLIRGSKRRGSDSREGEIIEIIERSSNPYVGILQITGNKAWVIVENKRMSSDIEISMDGSLGGILNRQAQELFIKKCRLKNEDPQDVRGLPVKREYQGLKVAVRVIDFPRQSLTPVGILLNVLGKAGENDTEMCSILAEYGLPYKFPDEIEEVAAKIPTKIGAKELEGRKDFRSTLTFTIDPADAKDFDDACSFKRLPNGNAEVGVHIADVSHYVREGSPLDKEAYARATSVYLVDRTVPMLPEVLSNNLCSLRPGEEKLTFSAVFEINEKAEVVNEWFGRTIICSNFRFAYEEAQQIIDSGGDLSTYKSILSTHPQGINTKTTKSGDIVNDSTGLTTAKPSREVTEAVLTLHHIAEKLREKRFKEGSIEFERPEMKVVVDEKGRPIDVIQKHTSSANWLIEELMLLANKAVAHFVANKIKNNPPTFVYRIHDQPNMEKVLDLKAFIKHFGYKLERTDTPNQLAKSLNKLTKELKGKPECDIIELLALRCMARAEYSTENIGHYGLGFRYYTHFTSPIRRYPDMMVHRLLSYYLNGGKSVDKQKYEEYCQHSSQREQLATEAERASNRYKMAEYMKERIGQIFDGTICSITEWGMYVEVEPTKIEGMIALRDLQDDYYEFDDKAYCAKGRSTGKTFSLGEHIRVRVTRASLEQKTIDFELVTSTGGDTNNNHSC